MIVTLSPQRSDAALVVSKQGDKLTIHGVVFDFSVLPDGATMPAGSMDTPWIIGDVERLDGHIRLTLALPHGPHPSAAVAWPDPLINPPDGQLELPQ